MACLGSEMKGQEVVPRWMSGRVVKTWDAGYPYLVELDVEPGTFACSTWTWAPMDTDDFVRRRA